MKGKQKIIQINRNSDYNTKFKIIIPQKSNEHLISKYNRIMRFKINIHSIYKKKKILLKPIRLKKSRNISNFKIVSSKNIKAYIFFFLYV